MKYQLKGLLVLVASAGVLLLISWIFIRWDLDRSIAARFYTPESGWYLNKAQPWYWLYRYGTIPGIVLTVFALICTLVTYLRLPEKQWHRYFLLVLLTTIIGAGVLVNSVLKPYCGRPRPSQVREFGGHYVYRHVLDPGLPGKGESFPSGHSTMGFIFVSLVYFRRKAVLVAWIGGLTGLVYGGLISAARVVQGAHFVTDCFWSLGIIWLVATVLYYFVLRIPDPKHVSFRQFTRRQKQAVVTGGILLSAVLAMLFLTRRPYFETYHVHVGMHRKGITEMQVGLAGGYDKAGVRYIERGVFRILVHASGFAFPGSSEKPGVVSAEQNGSVFRKVFRLKRKGYFSEIRHEIEVVIPVHLKDELTVVFLDESGNVSKF